MKGIRVTSDSKRVNVYKHDELIGYYSTFDHARVARNDESPSWLTTVIPSNAEAVWSMFLSKLREIHSIHFSVMVDHKPSSLSPVERANPWLTIDFETVERRAMGYYFDSDARIAATLANKQRIMDSLAKPREVTLDEDESIVVHAAGLDDISFVIARNNRGVIVTVNQPDSDGRVGVIYDEPLAPYYTA